MFVKVIEIDDKYFVVEYTDKQGMPQRKIVAKEYYPELHVKGAMDIREYILRRAIDYSDVDLHFTLGRSFSWSPITEITKALRESGFWTREDIRRDPNAVILVLKRLAKGDKALNYNAILQAALTVPEASVNQEQYHE